MKCASVLPEIQQLSVTPKSRSRFKNKTHNFLKKVYWEDLVDH